MAETYRARKTARWYRHVLADLQDDDTSGASSKGSTAGGEGSRREDGAKNHVSYTLKL